MGHDKKSWDSLQKEYPEATESECRRFLAANPRDAADKLAAYLRWRTKHKLDEIATSNDADANKDSADWENAFQRLKISLENHTVHSEESMEETVQHGNRQRRGLMRKRKQANSTGIDLEQLPQRVPQLIVEPTTGESSAYDLTNHRIFYHLPARIDLQAAPNEVYAEIIALYLDAKIDRTDDEQVTLLVDVRPGPNWKNPPATHFLGFIRHVAHALHDLNPKRVHRCIVFPIPQAAVYLWKMVQVFLHPQVREVMLVIPGCASSSKSPTPTKELQSFMSKEAVDAVERARQQALAES